MREPWLVGSIGYIGFNGQMDSNICIRTLSQPAGSAAPSSFAKEKLYCWAGGGIVVDSRCEDEYQETFDKVNNLIRCLEERFL
jgi:para-aminobenzoate synthetase component 1